jgi:hypothetical protein
MWEWLLRRAESEGHVIKGAPVAIGIIAIILAALCYLVIDWRYSGRIDDLKEHIATLEASDKWHAEQLAEYQRVFPGRSTDEAVKEIAALRKDLTLAQKQITKFTERRRRHLRADEKSKLIDALMSFPRTTKKLLIFAIDDPHGEAMTYSRDFAKLIQSIGIDIAGPALGYPSEEEQFGVMVGVIDTDHPPPEAEKLHAALDRAGFAPRYAKFEIGQNQVNPIFFPFDLFIGAPDQ